MMVTSIRTFTLSFVVALTAILSAIGADDPPKIKLSDCPAPVKKTIELEAKGAKIDGVVKTTLEEETTYAASFVMGTRHYHIEVDADGTLNELSLEVGDDEVAFTNCPAAVQAMFRKETSKETKFDVLSKDLKYGVTIYEAVVAVGNKEYSIVVAENGTLVEKMLIFAEDEIDLSHCPTAVQHTLKEHARGGEIGGITRSTGISGHVYEAELQIAGKAYLLEVTEGGGLITKSLLDDLDQS